MILNTWDCDAHTNRHTHITTCVNSKRSVNKMASDPTSDVALDCELEVLLLEGSKSDVGSISVSLQ